MISKLKKIKENFGGKLFLENPKTAEEAYLLGYKIDYCIIDVKAEDKLLKTFKFLKM